MSADLEARRMVHALIRSGVALEDVIDTVLEEVIRLGASVPNMRVEQSAKGGTVIHFLPGKERQVSAAEVAEAVAAAAKIRAAEVVADSELEHNGPPIVVNGVDVEDDEVRDASGFGGSDYL